MYLLHPHVKKNTLSYLEMNQVKIYTDTITFETLKDLYNPELLTVPQIKETGNDEPSFLSDDVKSVILLSTSGTTSTSPKFVRIPFHNMFLKSCMIASHLRINKNNVSLLISPLCFVQSIWALIIHLIHGAHVHFSPFLPKQFDYLLSQNHITTFITTPSVVRGVIDSCTSSHQLRLLSIGGDYMDDNLLKKLNSKWPDVSYANVYGATETCAADTILDPSPFGEINESFYTVGKPTEYSRIFILSDSGKQLPPNQEGNICIQSPFLIDHYDNNNVPIRGENGYFLTYDIGYLDEKGFLHYCGRSNSIIVCNGEKISACEIENQLYKIEGVHQAVVIGKPHSLYGEIPVAFLVADDSVNQETIYSFLANKVERFKIPKEIVFTNELKRTNSGKLIRNYLAYE